MKVIAALSGHVLNNKKFYLFLLLAFMFGIAAGAFTVNGLSAMQSNELSDYLQGFLQLLENQSLDSGEQFSAALLENLKLILLIWVLGVSIIGIPVIFAVLSVKGFITGFTSGFIIHALGMKGVLFSLFTVLPKELILVPCLIAIGVNGINFSRKIAKSRRESGREKTEFKSTFLSYCFVTIFFSLCILIGLLLDAYITPILIKTVATTILT